MRTELYDAVRESTAGEFDLLGELDGAAGWMAYLAREASGGALAVLVLEEAPAEAGGQFDLRVLRRLDAREPVGFTTCGGCRVENEGWPRFCGACGRDLSGMAADAAAPGGSAAELLAAVREAAEGEYEVLGSIPRAEGGGEVYFAREEASGRIVGLTLQREYGDEYALSLSWAADDEALAHPATGTASYDAPEPWTPEPEPVAPAAPVAATPPSIAAPPIAPVSWPGEASAPPSLLLDPPPPPRRDRRTLALYGAAAALLLAAAGVLVAFQIDGGDRVAVATPPAPEGQAPVVAPPPAPAPPVAEEAPVTPQPASTVPPISLPPASPEREARPATEPRREPARERDRTPPRRAEAPRPEPAREAAPPPVAPRPAPPAPVATAPSAEEDGRRIRGLVAGYASAVESRQTSRIQGAYAGITGAELGRWERFFQPLDGDSRLRVRYSVEQGPTVQGNVGSVIFLMTLSYRDAQGAQVSRPILQRGIVERGPSGWFLREVRILQ